MADKKISELTAATGVNYTDSVPIVQTGSTKKIPMSLFALRWNSSTSKWDANSSKISGLADGVADDEAATIGQLGAVASFIPNKNAIHNGGMDVDQRNEGSSQTIVASAALAYTVDRWWAYCTGANVTGQQQSVTGWGSAGFPFVKSYVFSGAGSNSGVQFGQRIEMINSYHFADQDVCLSAYMKVGSGTKTVTWTASYANSDDTFGSIASPTKTTISTGTFLVTTTPTRFQATFTGPSESNSHGIEIVFSVSSLLSGESLYITGVQLELGTVATVFERLPITSQIQFCQRYYEKSYSVGTSIGTATANGAFSGGTFGTSTVGLVQINFRVTKRVAPSCQVYGTDGSSGNVSDNVQRAATVVNVGTNNASVSYGGNSSYLGYTHFVAQSEL